jgi:hypothetical protein
MYKTVKERNVTSELTITDKLGWLVTPHNCSEEIIYHAVCSTESLI